MALLPHIHFPQPVGRSLHRKSQQRKLNSKKEKNTERKRKKSRLCRSGGRGALAAGWSMQRRDANTNMSQSHYAKRCTETRVRILLLTIWLEKPKKKGKRGALSPCFLWCGRQVSCIRTYFITLRHLMNKNWTGLGASDWLGDQPDNRGTCVFLCLTQFLYFIFFSFFFFLFLIPPLLVSCFFLLLSFSLIKLAILIDQKGARPLGEIRFSQSYVY